VDSTLSFCMVTTFYPPHHFGGDAMYVYRLSNALARRGHDVTVVHNVDAYRILRRSEPEGSFPNEPGVTVHPIRSTLGPVSPLVTYLTGRPGLTRPQLDRIFAAKRFDVVHFHNISLMGGPRVLAYGDGLKLYTVHEHWLVCPMHTLWKYNRRPCEKPQCFRCSLSFHRPPQLWRYTNLLERATRNVDVFLSPGRYAAERHRERGFPREIRHLPPFVPTDSAAQWDSPAPERPYFLFVGRLERLKGVQTLIEAFRSYTAADLLVVGDGNYGPALREQAAALPRVRFLGRVEPSSLGALYERAIAVLLPTLGYEVFPFVSIEAFAHGTPAIVRDFGGLTEAVEDSGAGLTYRTNAELVEAMESLCTDPARRAELGERGRRACRERWSEESHLRAYFGLIDHARTTRSPVAPER